MDFNLDFHAREDAPAGSSGAPRARASLRHEWPTCTQDVLLGHLLDASGAIQADWERTRAACWRCFWATEASRRARRLFVRARWCLLERCVWPVLAGEMRVAGAGVEVRPLAPARGLDG